MDQAMNNGINSPYFYSQTVWYQNTPGRVPIPQWSTNSAPPSFFMQRTENYFSFQGRNTHSNMSSGYSLLHNNHFGPMRNQRFSGKRNGNRKPFKNDSRNRPMNSHRQPDVIVISSESDEDNSDTPTSSDQSPIRKKTSEPAKSRSINQGNMNPCNLEHGVTTSNRTQGRTDVNGNSLKNEGRYFNKLNKLMSKDEGESSRNRSSTPSAQAVQKMGIKRKIFSGKAPDFISLNAEEPQTKQVKLTNKGKNSSFGGLPLTRRESRRLFEIDPFSAQIRLFYEKNHQREPFLRKKLQLKSALENAIQYAAIQDSQVCLVGSSVNGFGRVTSDADFCLVIDPTVENIPNRRRIMNALYEVQRLLRRAPFVKQLQLIPAKVPILKFVDSFTGMECDLNVNNLTGLRNTELMKRYSMLDPRVQPLALCVKEWAHQKKINDASQGSLNSYSIVLMVVHFLQHGTHPAVLPSLQVEHPELFESSIPIMDVTAQASKIKTFRSRSNRTLSQLLREFFQYFVEKFNFDKEIISVRLGKAINVHDSNDPQSWLAKSIKIEEPFDQTNTARAVYNKQRAYEIFKKFREAHNHLKRGESLHCLINGAPEFQPASEDSVFIVDD